MMKVFVCEEWPAVIVAESDVAASQLLRKELADRGFEGVLFSLTSVRLTVEKAIVLGRLPMSRREDLEYALQDISEAAKRVQALAEGSVRWLHEHEKLGE